MLLSVIFNFIKNLEDLFSYYEDIISYMWEILDEMYIRMYYSLLDS